MPIILKVDPNTGTIYTDNGTTTTPTTGTCLVMSGSPIGAIPGVQGNLALDSTSGQVYLCTVTGSTAATATWIAAFSQNNQPNNFADTQTMAALDVTGNATVGGTLGVTGAATLSDTLDVTGNATVGGNLSYLPYVIAPTASQTLPNNQKVICQTGTLTADITLTTGSPPVGGEAIIYGSAAAYTTTVSTGVTSGSPYIEMPDGSQVYSYVIPASSPGAGIRIVWDGTNYRATMFGQVAPQQISYRGGTAASTTYGQTLTFTAPSNGWVCMSCIYNNDTLTSLGDITENLIINGTTVATDYASGSNMWSLYGFLYVTAGTAVSATAEYVVGTTALTDPVNLRGLVWFVPST